MGNIPIKCSVSDFLRNPDGSIAGVNIFFFAEYNLSAHAIRAGY